MKWYEKAVITILCSCVLFAAILAAGLLFCEVQMVKPVGIADQVEDVRDSVTHILQVGIGQGSGCVMSEDGIVFTAKHVVVGGGPGGIGSAIASARNGADTVLIERYGHLGGMSTGGLVTIIPCLSDFDGNLQIWEFFIVF